MKHTAERQGRHVARALCAALAAALCLTAVAPATAEAVTVNKATAKPNEDGGSGVIGGIDTRLTWEATVDEGESVDAVTLTLPQDGSFDGSTSRVTVLEGLKRKDVQADARVDGTSLTLDFSEPVGAGDLLRVEVTNMRFPPEGGDVQVTGTATVNGQETDLSPSPAIAVIANTPLQALVNWLDGQPWVAAWNSNQFLGMSGLPTFLAVDVMKRPDVPATVAAYQAHLDRVFGRAG